MLPAVTLVAQWREIESRLPEDWADARLLLTVEDEAKAPRASALLGPATPGRRGREIRFYCARRGAGPAPGAILRLLERLDEESIAGNLELLATGEPTVTPEMNFPETPRPTPAAWKRSLRRLATSQRKFRAAVAKFPEAKLGQKFGSGPTTYHLLIHGQIQHQLYHAGQIAMLLRGMGKALKQ